MELYVDPAATTSRAVLALCEAERLPVEVKPISLMQGEHHQPPLSELNPNRLVPVLVDDHFVLTESSAILRYLARRSGSRLYPSDIRAEARVDELMAWFETNFYRDFGYQFVYPQLMPHHERGTDEATLETIAWGRRQSHRWLQVLDGHVLAHGGPFLTGESPTLADLLGASILSLGDLVGCDFDGYPSVQRWYGAMNELDCWRDVNDTFRGLASSLADRDFVPLGSAASGRQA